MAVGARKSDILAFLIESLALTSIGGIIGIAFGFYPFRKAAGLKPIEALKFE